MACAKKCDRCGKLYEQYNSKNDRKNPNGIMVLNLDSQRRYFAHNALDLCPDCMKGFQDWFGEVKQMERLTYSWTSIAFGITWFTDRKEAEKKLKEMRE